MYSLVFFFLLFTVSFVYIMSSALFFAALTVYFFPFPHFHMYSDCVPIHIRSLLLSSEQTRMDHSACGSGHICTATVSVRCVC